MNGRPGSVARDQTTSPFHPILRTLCENSGARSAALVDSSGETVDYAGKGEPYDIRVAAAEWRLVLSFVHAAPSASFREVSRLTVRAANRTFLIDGLGDGYAMVLELPHRGFVLSHRALAQAARDTAAEARIALPERVTGLGWRRVRVRVRLLGPHLRRPEAIALAESWSPLEILGRYLPQDLGPREIAYRARFTSGAEACLVREPLGRWFVDQGGGLEA